MQRPNIIIITCHDLGTHLPCYGNGSIKTPNLDRIVTEGVQFMNHFSTAPLCSPARSSIITGRYPHSNGMNGLTHRGFKLNDNERLLTDYFNEGGYHTQLIGHQHEASDVARLHYKGNIEVKGFRIADVTPCAVQFIKKSPEQPFLLSIGTQEVHRNFDDPDYYTPSDPDGIKPYPFLKNCPEVRQDMAAMEGMIKSVDENIGIIYRALQDAGLMNNTLLIFTTDHGIAFPRAKSTLYDPGIKVALAMRFPEKKFSGTRIEKLTSHVDILPTLLELTGMDGDNKIQGKSFFPLITGERKLIREEVFAEKSWHGNEYDPMRCVRTAEFKYIRNFQAGYLYQSPADIFQSPSGKVMEPLRRKSRPSVELYQFEDDAWEMNNLAGNPEFGDMKKKLDHKLTDWMRESGDPLLDGHIRWPFPGKEHFRNNMETTTRIDI